MQRIIERKIIHLFYVLVDIFFIFISFHLPYSLRYSLKSVSFNLLYLQEYSLLFSLWGVSLLFILNKLRLHTTDRLISIPGELYQVVKAIVFSSVIAGVLIFFLQIKIFSRLIFTGAFFLLVFNLSSWRILKRLWIRNTIKKGDLNLNVLIVGANPSAEALLEEIRLNPYLGLKVVGFLDEDKTGKVKDIPILGRFKDLEEIVHRYFVDEIYIAINSERKKLAQIIALALKLGRGVKILADTFGYLNLRRIKLDYVGFLPLLTYYEQGLHGTELFFKRFFDIVISTTALIILFPLFMIISILIKLDSPGPVFYVCKRCGRKGKAFNFYKFRSMVKDAEKIKERLLSCSEVKGPIFKIKDDPRLTRIGRILRRYSLDELPQLFNVLKGDMSLVGPRPLSMEEVAKFDFWQLQRFNVRPGITCLWQVRGRSDLSFYKMVKLDLWYINNWSFGLDLKILWWTVPAVLKGKGAY